MLPCKQRVVGATLTVSININTFGGLASLDIPVERQGNGEAIPISPPRFFGAGDDPGKPSPVSFADLRKRGTMLEDGRCSH